MKSHTSFLRPAGFTSLLLGILAAASTDTATQNALPARLEQYLTAAVKLTPAERERLVKGEPVTKLLDADASKEVAVLGAIWIDAPISRLVEAVKDIESFERGGAFRITKRISTPPRLEDFSALRLPDEDLRDIASCRVGACEIKLGEEALRRFQSEIDWKSADAHTAANALMQRLALAYATRYMEGGNERLAVYRDTARPTYIAEEFRAMTEQMPELTTYIPDVRRYLLEYPRFTLPDLTSLLYWQEVQFGLKPTIRISHLVVRQVPEGALVASKMLYASHYFWTGLEVQMALRDASRPDGFWFLRISRSRADGLSGVGSRVVRNRVVGEVQKGTLAGLQSTKQKLQKTP